MAQILSGQAVVNSINERLIRDVEELKQKGILPTLAIVRVGERPDDLSYEKTAMARCKKIGVEVQNVVFSEDVSEREFLTELENINKDDNIHGILMFRPLPKHIDEGKARAIISPKKDIDGMTELSLAGVFTGSGVGFSPCTAQAVIEILDYYGIEIEGKSVCVIGRSLVVGRPVSMMLMNRNATVTTCHTRTRDIERISQNADIIVVCSGKMESVGRTYLNPNQVVIDVGIGWSDAKGKLCGDVNFDEAEPIVSAITPVPGGVGTVTTSVLVSHVVESARRNENN